MIDILKYRALKYFLFGSLYFSEGLQFSMVTVLIILYFSDKGFPIEVTTLVAGIAASPFILKFIWGPITDYFVKYGKKPFIVMGGLLGGICLFIVAFIDPNEALLLFTIFFFLSHVGVVFIDVTADGLAIQISKYDQRGKINAAMTTGLFVGLGIGAPLLATIAEFYSFTTAFIVAGFIIISTIILPIFIKEIRYVRKRQKIAKLLIQEFKKKNTILITLFGVVSAINLGMLILIIPDYMKNVLLLDNIQTGILSSLYPLGIVTGAILGGILVDKYGRKKILYISLTGLLIVSGLLIFVDSWQMIAILISLVGFLQGSSMYSGIIALFMDICNKKIGASQYAILTSISNFGEIGIATVTGALVVFLGYTRFFLFTAWIVAPALLLLYFVKEVKKD